MWIKSQNKHRLIKCNNIYVYKNFRIDKFVIINDSVNENEDTITLGVYSTEKQALKVLDEITEVIIYGNSQNVYHMPQDNEVKDENN